MRIFLKIFLVLIVAGGLLSGCKSEPAQPPQKPRVFEGYHALLDEIIRTPRGLFRGLDLNAPVDTVRKTEGRQPDETTGERMFYEYNADSLTGYTIEYLIREDSLQEINVQINTDDLELSSYLFCDLKDYYAHKLPNPQEDKGYVVYNCFEGQRKPYVVSLSDNSTPTRGIINMLIYKDN